MSVAPCDRCHSPLEVDDIRCPICCQATPLPANADVHAEARAEVLRCENCGAAVSYTIEHHAPKCGFCDSVMHVERPVDPLEHADWYLPFMVSMQQAQQALGGWLSTRRGWFTPKQLDREATLTYLRPLWWVAWICDVNAWVTWTAESDYGRRRAPRAPHAGHTPLGFRSLLVPGTRGLGVDECAFLTPAYRLETARDQPVGPVREAFIERFDVQRSLARYMVVSAIHSAAAGTLQQGYIPGKKIRNVKVTALIRKLLTHRYALPAYVLAYHYKGKMYRAVVSGQDARYVTGLVPKDYRVLWIILAVVAGILIAPVVLAIIVAIIGALL